MRDGINTPIVAAWGVISAVALFAFIVGMQVLYLTFSQADQQTKSDTGAFGENLLVEQEAKLQQRGWIDRQQGTIAIPIEEAMLITVEEMRNAEAQPPETREAKDANEETDART